MTRPPIESRLAVAAVAVILLVLAGCGIGESIGDSGIPTPGNGKGREGWYSVHDPETGRDFRCWWWSLDDSTSVWCYEPAQAGS